MTGYFDQVMVEFEQQILVLLLTRSIFDVYYSCATILLAEAEAEAVFVPFEQRDHLLVEKELMVRYGSHLRSVYMKRCSFV